jgi:hypothetical protein
MVKDSFLEPQLEKLVDGLVQRIVRAQNTGLTGFVEDNGWRRVKDL